MIFLLLNYNQSIIIIINYLIRKIWPTARAAALEKHPDPDDRHQKLTILI